MCHILKIFVMTALFFGCQKYSNVEQREGSRFVITPLGHEIESAKVVSWKVGKHFDQTVSKGFSFTFSLPAIEEDKLLKMFEERKVDSWLVKLKRSAFGGPENLINLSVPIVRYDNRQNLKVGSIKKVTLSVYYAAASVSSRLANLYCPAFNHRKVIDEIALKGSGDSQRLIMVSPSEESRIQGKIVDFSYGYITINGGMELKGDYEIELALFDSTKNEKKSNFFPYPGVIEIKKEGSAVVKGCDGFEVPIKEKTTDPIDRFKFGR